MGGIDHEHQYLVSPALLQYYPIDNNRFHVCFGIELGYLLKATISGTDAAESIDVTGLHSRFKAAIDVGGGYDFAIGDDVLTITAIYAHGALGLLDTQIQTLNERYKPRELRVLLGWLL